MPTKKDIVLFYILSFTWGIVFTVVGLFALLGALVFIGPKKLKIRYIAGRIAVTTTDRYFGGVSLGIVYFVDKSDRHHTHCHEIGHTIQNIYMGPLFIFLVAIPSFIRYHRWDKLKAKNPLLKYDDAWYEGQATNLGMKSFYELIAEKLKESK
jgi:hypothetical protein